MPIARFADNGQYNLRLCFKQEDFRGRPPARSRGPPTAAQRRWAAPGEREKRGRKKNRQRYGRRRGKGKQAAE